MIEGSGWLPTSDALVARDVVCELRRHDDAEVTVNIAGTFVDVCRVTYDPDRDKIVLRLHPDDVDDALRRLFRRASTADRVTAAAARFDNLAD